ncbi:MAG: SDR family oxidoreductase [Christensenella sp.]|nr:SDR family oxidoreductase [Christensenella sp.]
MLFDIKGKNAIITGASRGIGLGLAEGFAKAGANLILIARNMAEADLARLRAYGIRAESYAFDLSEPEGIPALVKTILADWNRIDILINNAGAQRRNNSVDFTDEDWDFVNNVNAKSVFVLCREVGRHMIANGYGKIINFASLLSFQGGLRVPAYAASKGAVMQFTKSLANEWAKLGVNVNCIAPGYIDTDMNTALINDPVRNEQITIRIPAGRWGQPEDLVGTAIFLASHASDYVHGITIPVDGGWMGR